MQTRGSPRVPKNSHEESSEKTITLIHRHISEERDDTTYNMPPRRHEDETDSEDEVLVKRMKKMKQAVKPS